MSKDCQEVPEMHGDTLPVDPQVPGEVGGELATLSAWLDFQRETLLHISQGLSEQQLKERSCAPSTLSLLGLVRHMTEVEQGWFQRGVCGLDVASIYYSAERPDDDFDALDGASVPDVFKRFREECARSREVVDRVPSLDEPLKGKRAQVDGRSLTVRWVMVHMIEEYARHNGHADLIRQRIDGVTGR
jgi:uncharacterized damage-inducible protein DinB